MKYKFYVHIFISCTEWEGDVLIYIYFFFLDSEFLFEILDKHVG